MRLLHLDSSILGDHSVSRTLSRAVVDRFVTLRPTLEVHYRDLVHHPIGHLTGRYLAGQSDDVQHDQALQEDLHLGGHVLQEFLDADIVVIGVAQYNFSIPSQLKAWIDRVSIAGKTFRYTDKGPIGLVGDKRVVLAIARGGFYGRGSPAASLEHTESYLRSILSFMGVKNPQVIAADGISIGPDQRKASIDQALTEIRSMDFLETAPA